VNRFAAIAAATLPISAIFVGDDALAKKEVNGLGGHVTIAEDNSSYGLAVYLNEWASPVSELGQLRAKVTDSVIVDIITFSGALFECSSMSRRRDDCHESLTSCRRDVVSRLLPDNGHGN